MVRKYEIMYIICLNIEEDEKKVVVECFDGILIENGVEIIELKEWGKCCLVYEINDYCDGFYYIVKLNVDKVDFINEFDCLVKIFDDIICYMVIKEEV